MLQTPKIHLHGPVHEWGGVAGGQALENSERDGNTRAPYLPPEKPVCNKVKKQQLELDMEQWTGSKLGKEYLPQDKENLYLSLVFIFLFVINFFAFLLGLT